jgi:hypothetical protein
MSRAEVADIVRRLGIEKVYLDSYRGIEAPHRPFTYIVHFDESLFRTVADYFESLGVQAVGGVCLGSHTPDYEDAMNNPDGSQGVDRSCMSGPNTIRNYTELFRRFAAVTDEILIDDVYYIYCFCERCMARFNEHAGMKLTRPELAKRMAAGDKDVILPWTQLSDMTMKHISDSMTSAAREVNPKIRLSAKVVLGNHEHPYFGQTPTAWESFDGVAVGVENREKTVPGGGFCNYRYIKSVFGDKAYAIWPDALNGWDWRDPMGGRKYLEQLRAALLACPKELILFSMTEFEFARNGGTVKLLERELPKLRSLSDQLGEVKTISHRRTPAFADIHSPEMYLVQHLFSMGVSSDYRPIDAKSGAKVEVIGAYAQGVDVEGLLKAGKTVVVTSEGVRILVEDGKAAVLGLDAKQPLLDEVAMVRYFEDGEGKMVQMSYGNHMRVFAPVGPVCKVADAEVKLWAVTKDQRFPVLFEKKHGAGRLIVTCFTLLPAHQGTYYPEVARQLWRDVAGEELGVKLKKDGQLSPASLVVGDRGVSLWNLEQCQVRLVLSYHPKIYGGKLELDARWYAHKEEGGWIEAETIMYPDEMRVMARK